MRHVSRLFLAAIVYLAVAFGVCPQLQAQTYSVLHNFMGMPTDGSSPEGALIEDPNTGALYGTTENGGTGTNIWGTLFTIAKDGTGYAVLHSISPPDDGSGANPRCTLLQGTDGALYGATFAGDLNVIANFRLNTNGSGFTVIGPRGLSIQAGLIQGRSDGRLYGPALSQTPDSPMGNVFAMNTDGSGYSVLHNFTNMPPDGSGPFGGLLEASDGALYGTTRPGGSNNQGTIFTINEDGTGYTVLHEIKNNGSLEGAFPDGALVEESDGLLYGTAEGGGTGDEGTLFAMAKDGTGFVVLHTFGSFAADGNSPRAGVVFGPDGALYGTTFTGGSGANGTIFRVNTDGTGYTVLHNFTGSPNDGGLPSGAVLFGSDGAIYGTTSRGGSAGGGVVYQLILN